MRRVSLLLLALLLWAAKPAQAQIDCQNSDPSTIVEFIGNGGGKNKNPPMNRFKVEFCGSNYNPTVQETTFKYRVTEITGQGLSHWSLQMCPLARSRYVNGSIIGSYKEFEIGNDPSTGINNVFKWDLHDNFTSSEFSFRLKGYFDTEPIVVNAKAGRNNSGSAFTILGPSCVVNACAVQEPIVYEGGYVLNDAKTRAFIKVDVPEGATSFEFYNKSNLIVGDPESSPESNTVLPGMTRAGTLFTFAPEHAPRAAYFPITRDNPNTPGIQFFLRITDACGQTLDVDPVFAVTGVEGATARRGADLSARPNPSAGEATIHFSLAEAGPAHLAVYDVLGREVAVLVNGTVEAGERSVRFDGAALPAGIYVYRLTAGGHTSTRSLLIAR